MIYDVTPRPEPNTVLVKAKNIFASKTIWFNVISGGLEIAQILLDFRIFESQQILLGMAVGNVLLRYITKQPVSASGQHAKPVEVPSELPD